ERRDSVEALAQVAPETLEVVGAGDSAGDADDGDPSIARGHDEGHLLLDRRDTLLQGTCQRADGGMLEELDQRYVEPQSLLQFGANTGSEQRVASEIEESIVQADPIWREVEDARPDLD